MSSQDSSELLVIFESDAQDTEQSHVTTTDIYSFGGPPSGNGVIVDSSCDTEMQESDDSWMLMFEQLKVYCEHKGHANVPFKHRAILRNGKIVRLGAWLAAQRQNRRLGVITVERHQLLQELCESGKFKWNYQTEVSDEKWEKTFNYLLEYCDNHGHCNVPKKYQILLDDGSSLNLGNWLNDQRKAKGKNSLLADREAKLQVLVDLNKLKWKMPSPTEPHTAHWETMMALLLHYNAEQGSMNVPQNYIFKHESGVDVKLGKWVSRCRQKYALGTLDRARQSQLQVYVDQGRFSWSLSEKLKSTFVTDEQSFEKHLDFLKSYAQLHQGSCNVPQQYVHNDDTTGEKVNLGQWLNTQRKFYKKGTLLPNRKLKLQELVDQGKLVWSVAEKVEMSKNDLMVSSGLHRTLQHQTQSDEIPSVTHHQADPSFQMSNNIISYINASQDNQIPNILEQLERQRCLQQHLQYHRLLLQYQHGHQMSQGMIHLPSHFLDMQGRIQAQLQPQQISELESRGFFQDPDDNVSYMLRQQQQQQQQQQELNNYHQYAFLQMHSQGTRNALYDNNNVGLESFPISSEDVNIIRTEPEVEEDCLETSQGKKRLRKS